MQDNLIFLHEDVSFRLARYLRRKFGKKIGCDEKSLIMFYKTLRRTLSFYKNVDNSTTLVGLEFLIVKLPDKDVSIGIFLVFNNKKTIEIKQQALSDAVIQMFGQRLAKDGRLFFHWKEIEDFEGKLFALKQK